MTTKDSILALAAKISNGTVPNVATDAQALGELAKAMCGSAPTEPIATVDDAIAFITSNYSGGGGGGVDVGAPTVVIMGNAAPEPGGYISNSAAIAGIAIGETTIVPVELYNDMASVASGATATTKPVDELNPTTCSPYVVTVDDEEFTAVEAWDGTLTPGTYDTGMTTCNVWSFTVPALEYNFDEGNGQILYLYMH